MSLVLTCVEVGKKWRDAFIADVSSLSTTQKTLQYIDIDMMTGASVQNFLSETEIHTQMEQPL